MDSQQFYLYITLHSCHISTKRKRKNKDGKKPEVVGHWVVT